MRTKKYMGLLNVWGRSRKVVLAKLGQLIMDKLKGWKEKLLSMSGREILIHAVGSAMPTYTMSCLRLVKE